jgi:quercetin dioxygenase-like cupin family protein
MNFPPEYSLRQIMKSSALTAVSVLILAFGIANLRAEDAPLRLKPEEMKWVASPSMHGLMTAVLAGNPAAPGPYVERILIPPNSRLLPHSHPNEARLVTVLSGTLYFAFGETFDEAKLMALPAGSFFAEPENVAHHALTKDDGAVLQLQAMGPAGATTYVKAAPAITK